MWFIAVEVEQEKSAPPAKKNTGSAPAYPPKRSEKSLRQKLLHISLIVSGIGNCKRRYYSRLMKSAWQELTPPLRG